MCRKSYVGSFRFHSAAVAISRGVKLCSALVLVAASSACGSSAASDLFASSSLGSNAGGGNVVNPSGGAADDGASSSGGPGAAGFEAMASGGASTLGSSGASSRAGAGSGGASSAGGDAGSATTSAGSSGTTDQCVARGAGAVFSAETGHCYLVVQEQATFADAAAHCTTLGAHLVTIANAVENTFVSTLIADEDHWLGANDGKSPMEPGVGTYAWVTGEPFSYQDWTPGQPNATPTDCDTTHGGAGCYEHCAFQWAKGSEWNDRSCLHLISSVCEWDGA